ncbi:DUF5336 domain-containing protein [Streptomyces fagopyri]|uniref:DUF5336 domain-containing protein n=1 Tax=Streptomyces fagopyri TaxID=2662397 RepID=UPI0036A2F0D2
MNIRSLTRGDGVVIGAAVLLFIASFLALFSIDAVSVNGTKYSYASPGIWSSGPFVFSVILAGLFGAGLVVASRALPRVPKVAGLDLGPFGVALTVFAAWSALGNLFDPAGGGGGGVSPGAGLILSLIATLVMAAAAIATPLVPALQVALVPAPQPAAPQPYGGQPQGGYGYPGAQQPGQPSYGGQPQQGQAFGAQPGQPQQAPTPQPQLPAGDFSPFWFAVPVPRPLFSEDGSPAPIAELAPGTWYLAVEQRGQHLVAQTQDGRRGVLHDSSGIQRG